jgi:hypothetical protein
MIYFLKAAILALLIRYHLGIAVVAFILYLTGLFYFTCVAHPRSSNKKDRASARDDSNNDFYHSLNL